MAGDTAAAAAASLEALDTTPAQLVGVLPAREVVPWLEPRRYLHAGPPIGLEEIPGPMRGALQGALVFEGEVASIDEAERIIDAGDIALHSCNDAGGVGAMAGIVTPGMPVVVARTPEGMTAFSPLNEGLGKALRFGSTDSETLTRLKWMGASLAGLLDRAIQQGGEIVLTELQAEALRRGDECHNRNVAASAALLLRLTPALIRCARKSEDAAAAIERMAANPHFFLPFSMASAKAVARSAHGVAGSPIVTTMCANGVRFGIQVSGCGDQWFLGEAPVGRPKLFEGFTLDDAQPTMGDSFITETVGLGAFALTAAPAISSFLGTSQAEAGQIVSEMTQITSGTSSRFLVPSSQYEGTPLGIDVELVARTSVPPAANNGLAHRQPGIGQVGAGLTRVPLQPFIAAAGTLSEARAEATHGQAAP